jgi:hypothetical protein
MPNTFELIASSTVGAGGASAITFSSIPSTYTDLCVQLSVRSAASAGDDQLRININGAGVGSNFSLRGIQGSGSSVSSGNSTTGWIVGGANANNNTANTFTSIQVYFPNYTSSNNKSMSIDSVMENNATTAYAELNAALYSNSSAINSLAFLFPSANLVQYSTAYLYGVKNA